MKWSNACKFDISNSEFPQTVMKCGIVWGEGGVAEGGRYIDVHVFSGASLIQC